MNATVAQGDLKRALATTSRAATHEGTLPVTGYVLLTATDNNILALACSNLGIWITAKISAVVREPGAIGVPAGLLADFVNALPEGQLNLSVDIAEGELELSCQGVKLTLIGLHKTDFAPTSIVEPGVVARIDQGLFRRTIRRVATSAADGESRPILTGVHMELGETRFTLAASDGFRLAVGSGPLLSADGGWPIAVNIPASAMLAVARLLRPSAEPVEITINQQHEHIHFRLSDTVGLTSQLLQGEFPDWRALIPKPHATYVVFDRARLLRAVRLANSLAAGTHNIIRVTIEPEQVTIKSADEKLGATTLHVPATVVGPAARVAFHSRYILDVLTAIDGPGIALEMTSATSPAVFKSGDSDEGRSDYLQVIMPIQLSSW